MIARAASAHGMGLIGLLLLSSVARAADPPPYPVPKGVPVATEEPCKGAEDCVRAGYALGTDVAVATLCVVSRLSDPDKQAQFLDDVAQYRQGPARVAFFDTEADRLEGSARAAYVADHPNEWLKIPVFILKAEAREKHGRKHVQHMGSGSWRGLCLPFVLGYGHSDITRKVLGALSPVLLSRAAQDIVIDASQDADLFDWKTMAAHAQTNSTNAGMPFGGANYDALHDFHEFVRSKLSKAGDLCASDDRSKIREALFWFGYALHALQDLASHLGRTNPEHSYNAAHENNPDLQQASLELAEQLTQTFVVRSLQEGPAAVCRGPFKQYKGGPMTFLSKFALGLRPVNVISAKHEYEALSPIFEKVKGSKGAEVRWFGVANTQPSTCDGDCEKVIDPIWSRQ